MNQLIAVRDTDLIAIKPSLIDWVDRRIAAQQSELADANAGFDEALRAGFKTAPYDRLRLKAEKQILFYEKIKAAVEAGYLIVPNFDMQVFAIRTKRSHSVGVTHSRYESEVFPQKAAALPIGEGEYRNPIPEKSSEEVLDKDGKAVTHYFAGDLKDELDIPFHVVKPQVMSAINAARQRKIFDEIGIAHDRQSDPFILGRVRASVGWQAKEVSFFIGWFLDLDRL